MRILSHREFEIIFGITVFINCVNSFDTINNLVFSLFSLKIVKTVHFLDAW